MKMTNEAREEMENTLRHNDAIREEECLRMVQNTIEIPSDSLSSSYSDYLLKQFSDDSSDSVTRQIPTKPATSYNKSSTFPAKHKYHNEETPLKQPH